MTINRAEFLRLLPAAVGGEAFAEEGAAFVHRSGARQWRIALAPLPPIRLGPVAMERLRVELAFHGFPPGQAEAFVQRFLGHYQRGGG